MALALVGGAAVGALFGALYDVVKVAMGKTVMQYRPLLGDLKFTLDSLRPRIIQQIGDHNVELGLPNDEIESLQRQMEEGIELVRKLSNVGMWNCNVWCSCCCCTKPSYMDQLAALDRSLRILLEILRLQEARDVKEALLLARKIHDKQDELDKKMSDLLKVQREAGLTAQHETTVGELSASNTQTMVQGRVEGNSVQGAALGAAFAVLFGAVIQVKDNPRMFKRVLGYLKSTLDSLKPLIEELAKCNRVLHLPKEELENFRIEMEKGVELVVKCSKVRWWASYKKYEYSNKLLGLDESLQTLLHILRVQLARDVRESLVSVSNMEKVIKHIAEHNVVQNDEVAGKGLCPLPEPPFTTVGLDVLNVQERGDVTKATLVAARKIVGVKLIEGSGVLKDQNGIKGLYEVVEPPSPKVGVDVLNLERTMDVEETSDSTTNMEAGVKQIEESGVVKNQFDIAVTEPPSLRDGLEVANMQGTRDDKQIEGIGAVALQAPVSECEIPLLALESNIQFGLLDSMSSFEDNQQVIDRQQQQQNSFLEEARKKVQQSPINKYFNLPTEKAGYESEIEIGLDILTSPSYVQSREHDDASEPDHINRTQPSQHVSQLTSDDGFNWRKYGQKQAKGSKYPHSYYECTYHNCPTKKKVERSLNGEITEIVYKGSHNHPKPQSTRQSACRPIQGSSYGLSDELAPKISNPKVESAKTPDDLKQNSPIINSGVEDENEPVAKEWDVGNANDQTTHTFSASRSSIVKEPRTVVQTISEIDLVDDGYKWRKYGQKVMKGNFLPRAYYKCTYTGCPVRKHVERSPHDSRSVITTYEGKHNHDVPAACYSDIYSAPKKGASEHQSQSVLDGLDVHATEDAIKKTLVELEQELLNEGSGVVQDQIEIKSSREGIEPPLFVVGLDGLGPMDVKETFDSMSMETLTRQGWQSCFNEFSRKATLSTEITGVQSEIAEIIPKLNLKDVLIYCAHALAEDDLPSATISAEVLGQMVSVSGEPMQRLGAYMLEGLRVRLEKSRSSIYKTLICEVPTSSQLMSYVSVLYNICPYLKFAYMSANVVIREALENEPRIHILDFQIAQGSQWVPLIQDLARRPGGPPHIRITGFDDSQSAHARGGGLHMVGERLSMLAESCNVPFDFNAAARSACEFELENLRIQPGEALAVNFPYVLNQMPDESVSTQNYRDRLLRLLKSLSPKVMTLVEQECNANTSPFFTRFVELVDYYAAMFESIDVARPRDDKQRICAEMHVVAIDMVNMVACEGLERVKRPEPLAKWRSRMMMAGFSPYPLSSKVTQAIRILLKEYRGNYRLQEANGALYLGWMDRALVTASAWNISADGSGSSAHLFDKFNTVSAWNISADGSGPSTCLSDKFNIVLEPQSEPVLPRDDVPWAYNGVAVPSLCPICCEDLDFTDTSFLPCLCGFRLCLFCHNRILEEDGCCPGCRKPYEHEPVEAETSVHGGSLTFRSCSMITRS